jgi:hypothetical protein
MKIERKVKAPASPAAVKVKVSQGSVVKVEVPKK